MKEIWKDIAGYEGLFEISNLGRVKSIERWVKQGDYMRHVKESYKKLHIGPYGYPSVTLCKDGKSKTIPIHRLLAAAFIPNPECKTAVDHINTDRTDYRLENLRWVTNKENSNNELTLQHCRENTYTSESTQKSLNTKKSVRQQQHQKQYINILKMASLLKNFILCKRLKDIQV